MQFARPLITAQFSILQCLAVDYSASVYVCLYLAFVASLPGNKRNEKKRSEETQTLWCPSHV